MLGKNCTFCAVFTISWISFSLLGEGWENAGCALYQTEYPDASPLALQHRRPVSRRQPHQGDSTATS